MKKMLFLSAGLLILSTASFANQASSTIPIKFEFTNSVSYEPISVTQAAIYNNSANCGGDDFNIVSGENPAEGSYYNMYVHGPFDGYDRTCKIGDDEVYFVFKNITIQYYVHNEYRTCIINQNIGTTYSAKSFTPPDVYASLRGQFGSTTWNSCGKDNNDYYRVDSGDLRDNGVIDVFVAG
ncbi:MAG: hypothetical protein K2P99_06130 [Burkholderiales bacterium]|nr:hypothetical protein [Burkholderiales bacterium]